MNPVPPVGRPPQLTWDDAGHPIAARFADGYYASDPLGEVRHVFLQGTGLTESWAQAGGPRVIGETGFGTGLNFLMAWDLWRQSPKAPKRFDFVSVEAWPMSRQQLAKAHQAFGSQLAILSGQLLRLWPEGGLPPGRHVLEFEGGRVRLSLIVADALKGVQSFCVPGGVEAWFLDGFAPSQNPDMWTPALFTAIAKQSAPYAKLASFTAVGEVRRQLGYAGFDVTRAPGFGRKRHMTKATYTAQPWRHWAQPPCVAPRPSSDIAIIGAGVAGLTTALELAQRGHAVTVFDKADRLGGGASGLPAALLMPRPDLGQGMRARLAQQAFETARKFWAGFEGAYNETGIQHVPQKQKDKARFETYAQLHPASTWNGKDALQHSQGGVIDAPRALAGLQERLENAGGRVQLATEFHRDQASGFDAVVWATGAFLPPIAEQLVPFRMMAGEIIVTDQIGTGVEVRKTHIAPLHGKSVVGASFYPCEYAGALLPPSEKQLQPMLDEWGVEAPYQLWQGARATTPDQLPVVGPLVDLEPFNAQFAVLKNGPYAAPRGETPFLTGHWMVNGLGARGFMMAPTLAPLLADMIEGRVSRWPLDDVAALHPARFAVRKLVKA